MPQTKTAPWNDKLWDIIINSNPETICIRTGANFDNEKKIYSIPFMDNTSHINLIKKKITGPVFKEKDFQNEFELLILSYIINSKDILPEGKWISGKEVPGGSMFFTGPHQLPGNEISELFGKNPEGFKTSCIKAGGKKIEFGDFAFEFKILPKIPLACVLWLEDDEFPARANFLFDNSIKHLLPTDVILALVNSFMRILV